jgi:hypothetical protein
MSEQNQAIIVYRKQEAEYAHLMANLIAAFTEYEVALWEEKDWIANKSSTSSSQKIIFLGDTDEAHLRHNGMNWEFNLHNMKYGWLGNQCIVDVDTLPIGKRKAFVDYYQIRVDDFENKIAEYQATTGKSVIIAGVAFGLIGLTASGIVLLAKGNKHLIKYQYNLLVREFVLNNGLKKFMES